MNVALSVGAVQAPPNGSMATYGPNAPDGFVLEGVCKGSQTHYNHDCSLFDFYVLSNGR